MSDATTRGWGNPRANGYQRQNIVKVKAGGISLNVHKDIAPLVQGFVNEITAKGYKLAGRADDWGYCLRANRNNPNVLSNHSWGLAIDLNATTNPNTHDNKVHTDMPKWVIEAGRRWGFTWGGDYRGRTKDPMHFEILKPRGETQAFVRQLQAFFAGLKKAS